MHTPTTPTPIVATIPNHTIHGHNFFRSVGFRLASFIFKPASSIFEPTVSDSAIISPAFCSAKPASSIFEPTVSDSAITGPAFCSAKPASSIFEPASSIFEPTVSNSAIISPASCSAKPASSIFGPASSIFEPAIISPIPNPIITIPSFSNFWLEIMNLNFKANDLILDKKADINYSL